MQYGWLLSASTNNYQVKQAAAMHTFLVSGYSPSDQAKTKVEPGKYLINSTENVSYTTAKRVFIIAVI